MPDVLRQIYKTILQSQRILLVTHQNPDGDALACLSIMVEVLTDLQKDHVAYCCDKPSNSLLFLPHMEKITCELNDLASFDLIISLDCGSLSRTKLAEIISQRNPQQIFVEIDHHPHIEDVSDIEARDPQAASTTEILYDFLQVNNLTLNSNVANCILTGIVTDTGNFVYPTTSEKTITIAAEMLKAGARLPQILENTWRNKSLPAMKLWGIAMSRLQINVKYDIAFSILTLEDLADLEATEDDIDGVAGFMGNLPQVKAIMLLRQIEPGLIKGSLRTCRPEVDVSKLAQRLGGGGHSKAAGFNIKGDLQKIAGQWQIV
ncbi:MAG: MgpA protein [Candidatus Falkowbacteria bacterium GW2011_GWA2_39_24]|uniref:MgpA protein n=1 Tax=Candidatus Falkowbacteria bacterium GW2011_GWA2_39_24 TaxID=1618634 RepID=A0A0G0NH88_9BACT|nr:MAG: MgpA protein [Candidatus Falkowbacteria bacterium GW2011_GWA2_39_24]